MIKSDIYYLKQSPMFQLSLTSKELFHSNFVAWVISNYKTECSSLLTEYLNIPIDFSITEVKREEGKKDITVYFNNQHGELVKLIIENKVKGIPTYEQLLKYTTTAKNEFFMLLSLVTPIFAVNDSVYIKEFQKEWKCMDYKKLAEIFQKVVKQVEVKNVYHANVIKDYIMCATSLQKLSEMVSGDLREDIYNYYSTNTNIFSMFKEVRLHDFFLKLKHEMIAAEFFTAIKNEIPGIKLVSAKKWETSKAEEVFVGSGFTNGSGLSEVKYVIGEREDSPIILGVQIQGNQFRLFTESKKQISLNIAKYLHNNNMWFDFSKANQFSITEKQVYPKVGRKEKNFNTYSQTFYYKSVKLKECRIIDIVNLVTEYIVYIHEEKQNLLNIIDKVLCNPDLLNN
ncbi:PD-(D/E)XK nuclease family protein [Bacillus sp. AFS017274]|uniref:PD-(D/E)XK nuclease family protein n=1 Tax=Bacillus sp. AFS017274 TaxID=2033488 RepID=UPI000BF96B0C|nr:PD-(D/E)XK nuclease family protein [Bacillus sp. AFS017274]PEZ76350.1 hypothetical protein CN380_21390 [Bacillus sp. AFS017274]